jgi:hypothetical protein
MPIDKKERWVIAPKNNWQSNERWQVRLKTVKTFRWLEPEEILIYKTGLLNYYTVDFLFSIHAGKGRCISGDLQFKEGRQKSTDYVIKQLEGAEGSMIPLFDDTVMTRFLSVKDLYKRTQGRMLSLKEHDQFKKIYHAIQRDDWDTISMHLNGLHGEPPYKPERILINKE